MPQILIIIFKKEKQIKIIELEKENIFNFSSFIISLKTYDIDSINGNQIHKSLIT